MLQTHPGPQPGEVLVVAPPELDQLGATLGDFAGEAHDWLGLGPVDLTPLTLVLVADEAGFAEWSRGRVPSWGAGLTVPSRRLVVVRVNAGNPHQTLRHELAHLALHSRIRSRVPLWFSEGYAALASGEHGRLDALQLNLAVALGRVPSLPRLDAALRGGAADAGPAYALAASAVADIARRHPTGSLAPILQRMEQGEPFAEALLAATGLDPLGFGDRWYLDIRRRYNIGVWAVAGGAWVLVTLVLAFLLALRRQRDRTRRAALDHGWPLPPPDEDVLSVDDDSMTTVQSGPDQLDHPESRG